jgi:hypothetical protein
MQFNERCRKLYQYVFLLVFELKTDRKLNEIN